MTTIFYIILYITYFHQQNYFRERFAYNLTNSTILYLR